MRVLHNNNCTQYVVMKIQKVVSTKSCSWCLVFSVIHVGFDVRILQTPTWHCTTMHTTVYIYIYIHIHIYLMGPNLISLVKVSYTQKEESFCLGVNSGRWKKNRIGDRIFGKRPTTTHKTPWTDFFFTRRNVFFKSHGKNEKTGKRVCSTRICLFGNTTFGRLTRTPQSTITTLYARCTV
jgi:hypothetical protein